MLLTGLLLFTVTHLILSMAPARVNDLRSSMGDNPVKGIVSLLTGLGLLLIVLGWRASETQWIYMPPAALQPVALALIALGIYLFVVANRRSRVKQFLRHPQLTGLVAWTVGHLLLNGDSRSLLLFGTLGVWAMLEMLLINMRDGDWKKPDAPPLSTDLVTLAIAAVALVSLAFAHPWLAGVPAIAR